MALRNDSMMQAQLIPLDGGNAVEITRDLTLIGRKEDCDLLLDHKSVSKMHCVLVKTDGLLLLRDLGSTNGTRVNGQRVRRAALLPNDQLSIANFKFRVSFGPFNPPASAEDRTHQLSPEEIGSASGKSKSSRSAKKSKSDPEGPVQPRALPDVYPDESP
jgi:pSer/pThr/pTyr-binding forkhead associated (FHA) protein